MSTIKLKRGLSTTGVPLLTAGEPAFTMDTGRIYIGNGTSNTMFYNAKELGFRIFPVTLTNGDPTFKKIAINENFDTSSVTTIVPLDFRCSIPTPSTDRMGGGSAGFGYQTKCTGTYSFVANQYNISTGTNSSAFGSSTTATGEQSFTMGVGTNAETCCLLSLGMYNSPSTGSVNNISGSQSAIVVGNGSSSSARNNCFRVRYDGNVYGLAAFNSSGADYAEYFEWEDGNLNSEDRIGHFVFIAKDDKISFANSSTPVDEILGIVSKNASIVGNSASENWHDIYIKDNFGRIIYEIGVDNEGVEIKVPIINPSYNNELTYVPREDRKEWDAIGMLGRLRVKDDGTCLVGSRCLPNDDGIATNSESGFKITKRISYNVIEIILK